MTIPLRAAALFCLCLLLCVAAVPGASAGQPDHPRLTGKAAEVCAMGLLAEGLRSCRPEIDLSAACLPRESLGRVFERVMNGSPELFHVGNRLSYTYGTDGSVLTVTPSYRMEGEVLAAARQTYRDVLEEVLRHLAAAQETSRLTREALPDADLPAWGEADTVLFLHEYLAETYEYDTEGQNFDAFSLFRDGVGVCQAYALAFIALGRAAGLEVDMVTSREMDHAWNHVRVDGVWYHVDVTRDDPIREPDTPSVVRHDRLLRSDAGLEVIGYTGFACQEGHACADARFETAEGGAVLSGTGKAFVRLGTGWFLTGTGQDAGLWIPAVFPPQPSGNAPPDGGSGIPSDRLPGDMDMDGRLTAADLLCLDVCLPAEDAEGSRATLRQRLLDACG